jgi:hypothetical protein
MLFINRNEIQIVGKPKADRVKSDKVVPQPEEKTKKQKKKGSAGKSAGMVAFSEEMTIKQVEEIVAKANVELKKVQKQHSAAQKLYDKATTAKNAANVDHRACRIQLGDLRSAHAQASTSTDRDALSKTIEAAEAQLNNMYHTRVKVTGSKKNEAYVNIERLDRELRRLKGTVYSGNKILQANGAFAKSVNKKDKISLDGFERGKADLDNITLDVKALFADDTAAGKKTRVGFSGSDCGLVFMKASTAMSGKCAVEMTTNFAIACRNRFEVLQPDSSDSITDDESNGETEERPSTVSMINANVVPFKPHPKVDTVRGKKLKEITKIREHQRIRNRATKHQMWTDTITVNINGADVQIKTPKESYEALKELKRPEAILDHEELLKRAQTRRQIRGHLQAFQNARRRTNQRRTSSQRKWRAWSELAANELRLMKQQAMQDSPCIEAVEVIDKHTGWCSHCNKVHTASTVGGHLAHATECPHVAKKHFDTKLLYFEGKEGKGTNSPFGGHDRWTGNKMGNLLAMYLLYFGVPEDFTSCTCSYCSHRLEQARRTIIKKGKPVQVRVHGMLECRNPNCEAFKHGHAIKKRDAESSM